MIDIDKPHISDMMKKIEDYLKINLDIEDFSIKSTKKDKNIWNIKVEFTDKIHDIEFPTSAKFRIDTKTEIRSSLAIIKSPPHKLFSLSIRYNNNTVFTFNRSVVVQFTCQSQF